MTFAARVARVAACLLAGCAASPQARVASPAAPAVSPVLAGMQYLYGSGEGAAISRQGWAALVDFVTAQARSARQSVVLAEGARLDAPRFVPCGDKPRAVVFDMDETVILNLGFEQDELSGTPGRPFAPRWSEWEAKGGAAVAPTPGAAEAIARLRAMNVVVVFNSNRRDAAGAVVALRTAGLGPATHLDTLFVKGDDNSGDLKDARRWRIADRYCVVAMGGDQLGDFSDLFNDAATPSARRALTAAPAIASLWGHGWFVFPNPVYGRGLNGRPDDIFPADRRWHPTGGR